MIRDRISKFQCVSYLNPYTVYIFILMGLVVSAIVTESVFLSSINIVMLGGLPFYFLVVFVSSKDKLISLISMMKQKLHLSVVLSSIVFVYIVMANAWAGGYINSLFKVDPSNFPITHSVLLVLFAPLGIVYDVYNLTILYGIFIVTVTLGSAFVPVYLIFRPSMATLKRVCGYLVLVIIVSALLSLQINIARDTKNIVIEFAIWADFYSFHSCNDSWVQPNDKVVFLNSGNVLVYRSDPYENIQFTIKKCSYAEGM